MLRAGGKMGMAAVKDGMSAATSGGRQRLGKRMLGRRVRMRMLVSDAQRFNISTLDTAVFCSPMNTAICTTQATVFVAVITVASSGTVLIVEKRDSMLCSDNTILASCKSYHTSVSMSWPRGAQV